ncbi:hypothetical protein, partial [Candidatus Similichlamydia laticola]
MAFPTTQSIGHQTDELCLVFDQTIRQRRSVSPFFKGLVPLLLLLTTTVEANRLPFQEGGVFYTESTYTLDGKQEPTLYLLQLFGIRLRYLSYSSEKSTALVRSISRMQYFPRYGCDEKWIVFSRMFLEIIRTQSWYSNGWALVGSIGLTSAGPYLEIKCSCLEETLQPMQQFYSQIKYNVFSKEEIEHQKQKEQSWIETTWSTLSVEREAEAIFLRATSIPHRTMEFHEYDLPLPIRHFYASYSQQLTCKDIQLFQRDWALSPLEVICIGNTHETKENLLKSIHLLVNAVPTRVHSSRLVSYCRFDLLGGLRADFFCPSSQAIQNVPLFLLCLGPITEYSIIAADLLARLLGNPLPGEPFLYQAGWTICSGCVLFILRVAP